MNRTAWLICVIAAIGFAFDIYELLMLPLIVGPALREPRNFKAGWGDCSISPRLPAGSSGCWVGI